MCYYNYLLTREGAQELLSTRLTYFQDTDVDYMYYQLCYQTTMETSLLPPTIPGSLMRLSKGDWRREYISLYQTLRVLDINLKGVSLTEDVNLDEIATKLEGHSGADITNLCRCYMMSLLKEFQQFVDEY
ncbi:putative cell division cycle ATPase isoform X2 [Dysidea avara]|uniref:putative cell division cycle ATPase isoform X2 n=1 Tax=Dysidea avara TaxID=196820 RepID=UPI00331C1CB7